MLYHNQFYLLFLLGIMLQSNPYKPDFVAEYENRYQDIIINNKVVKKAINLNANCGECYALLQPLLNKYKRPFTMLDIGAAQGYYSLRVAHDYDAVCIMIEANNPPAHPHAGDQLINICNANNTLKNIIFLNKLFTPAELQHLGECEHFDVVLALNMLHEFNEQWQDALDAIMHMGDFIVIKLLPEACLNEEEKKIQAQIEAYIITYGGTIAGTIPHGNADSAEAIYVIESPKKYLQRKTWLRSIMKEKLYRIESSFEHKILTKPNFWPKNTFQSKTWIPGINLCTFKMCNGVYPTKETIKKSLASLKDTPHSDWLINNMIVQGDQLLLIDHDDQMCRRFFSTAVLEAHHELLDLNDPQKIEHYFWHTLIKIPVLRRHVVKFFNELFPPACLLFDIGSHDEVLVNRYLGYGAKIIYLDTCKQITRRLCKKFGHENFFATDRLQLAHKTGSNATLDSMIALYGTPQFCNIHLDGKPAYHLLKTLSQLVPCLAFKFAIQDQEYLRRCLDHLNSLGYTRFNFSVRDIPSLIFEDNKYTGQQKKWACSIKDLLQEINEFALLDHNGKKMWGFIYAQRW